MVGGESESCSNLQYTGATTTNRYGSWAPRQSAAVCARHVAAFTSIQRPSPTRSIYTHDALLLSLTTSGAVERYATARPPLRRQNHWALLSSLAACHQSSTPARLAAHRPQTHQRMHAPGSLTGVPVSLAYHCLPKPSRFPGAPCTLTEGGRRRRRVLWEVRRCLALFSCNRSSMARMQRESSQHPGVSDV